MPLNQPTRAAILEGIKADMRLELGTEPLRRSVEYALARVLTGQSKGQYGFLFRVYRNSFPDTADEESFWRWARTFGIDQKQAQPWQGIVRFTGVDTTTIPISTPIVRTDGVTYTTDVAADIGDVVSGYVDIACTAIADDAGTDANNDDFQPLSIVTPITDVDNACIVQSTATTGSDIEDVEDGLVRLLVRLRTPPSGGGPGDYVAWALEVPGITRAWEFANLFGPNTVGVAFVRDDDGTGAAIIPDAGERATAQTYLNGVAPITVGVTVIELVALTVPIQISALDPDTAAVRAAIDLSLEDFFVQGAAPGATMARSRISAAISSADGELSHVLDTPASDVTSTTLQMPILGTVTVV